MAVFVTSDLHLSHDKCFLYEPRGFTSIQAHDAAIVERWNKVVSDEDIVYILGDIALTNIDTGIETFNRLNGHKIIILGNHDTNSKIERYEKCANTDVLGYADVLSYKKYHFYLSHYPTITDNHEENVSLKRRLINLCGHTHTQYRFKDMETYGCYHVEMDAHNCTPVSLDTIIDDLKFYYNTED